MEVGHLERIEKQGRPVVYGGQVEVGEVIGDVYLVPLATKRDPEKSPDYQVKLRKPNEAEYRNRGAAWIKEFKDGSGQFFSITFDAPEFLKPVYVAAFPADADEQPNDTPDDEPALYNIRWGRPRGVRPQAEPGGAPLNDEIPY